MTTKMGLRCFIVLVCMIHFGFSLECHNVFSVEKTTCDECIRCGGIWCKDPKEAKQCKNPLLGKLGDEWCPDHKEMPHVETVSRDGIFVPQYIEQLAEINFAKVTHLKMSEYFPAKTHHIPQFVYNTTQTSDKSKVVVQVKMVTDKIQVTTTVRDGFCSQNSPKFEYVFVEVRVPSTGISESAVLKYHVPCGCGCSEEVMPADKEYCQGHGNLTCGSCSCNEDWKGKYCDRRNCQRGDVSTSCVDTSLSTPTAQCSGNGVCDECSKCQCFDNVRGWQYFNPDNNCKDLCSTINDSECHLECLTNNTAGPCRACAHEIVHMQRWNESLLEQRDESNRMFWVKCSVTFDYEVVEYWAMKEDEIHMMRHEKKNTGALVNAGGSVTIPVVIGLIAAIAAAVAAAVGYVMWKGQGALPAAGSNYANIEPEDSVGVNPLYKPPTSSFKNPMYAAKS